MAIIPQGNWEAATVKPSIKEYKHLGKKRVTPDFQSVRLPVCFC